MIEGHTLVIPTFNRPGLLAQLVRYLCARGGPQELLVLDSSAPAAVAENGKMLSACAGRARHVVFPESEAPAAKLAQGLRLVTTPYVSCCADDDVVFPEALRESVRFLERSPDYVGAHGLYLNFRREGDRLHLTGEYAGPGNEARHPGARIFRLLQKYESLFYAVYRTADLRDAMAPLPSLGAIVFQELFQSVAVLVRGKVRRLPRAYAARQSIAAAEPGRERWQTFDWFAQDPAAVIDGYGAYREQLWAFYDARPQSPRLDRAAFCRVLDLAHAAYFAEGCRPGALHAALQAAYWPDDGYLDVARVNLLAPPLLPWLAGGTARPRFAAAARYAAGALCALPYLAWLKTRIARECRGSWQCVPARSQKWLAMSPAFRDGCVELCRYMDCS
jgi:glycosyltransferase domain-containing protein